MLNDLAVIGMIQRGMSWMSRNHDVVAQNIANADTPDFKAKELRPLDLNGVQRQQLTGVRMQVTAPGHLVAASRPSHGNERVDRDTYEISTTGNSVNLEEQGVKIARNAMDYQLATSLYSKSVGMVRAVISNNR